MAKKVNMLEPPTMLASIRKAGASPAELPQSVGEAVRALVATKIGAVALQIGAGSSYVASWMLDGMDITSRLIVLVEDSGNVESAQHFLGDDIRVAVHAQDTGEFLEDIKAHRFQIVLFDRRPRSQTILDAALNLLEPGALFMCVDSRSAGEAEGVDCLRILAERELFRPVDMFSNGELLVAARRLDIVKPVRRGARRARHKRAESYSKR